MKYGREVSFSCSLRWEASMSAAPAQDEDESRRLASSIIVCDRSRRRSGDIDWCHPAILNLISLTIDAQEKTRGMSVAAVFRLYCDSLSGLSSYFPDLRPAFLSVLSLEVIHRRLSLDRGDFDSPLEQLADTFYRKARDVSTPQHSVDKTTCAMRVALKRSCPAALPAAASAPSAARLVQEHLQTVDSIIASIAGLPPSTAVAYHERQDKTSPGLLYLARHRPQELSVAIAAAAADGDDDDGAARRFQVASRLIGCPKTSLVPAIPFWERLAALPSLSLKCTPHLARIIISLHLTGEIPTLSDWMLTLLPSSSMENILQLGQLVQYCHFLLLSCPFQPE
jgi:hypothetical protein